MSSLLTEKYPAVEQDLEEVVDQHGVLEAVGGAVLHVERPHHLHHHQVAQTEQHGGQGAGHQQPVRHPGVGPLLQHSQPVRHGGGGGGAVGPGKAGRDVRHLKGVNIL